MMSVVSKLWHHSRVVSYNHNMFISCMIFEHFALQTDPVTEFIKLGSVSFKEGATLAPKLARSAFLLEKRLHPL